VNGRLGYGNEAANTKSVQRGRRATSTRRREWSGTYSRPRSCELLLRLGMSEAHTRLQETGKAEGKRGEHKKGEG
jgi:hypothetical protein